MGLLGRAFQVAGEACKQALGLANNCNVKVCCYCGLSLSEGEQVTIIGQGEWHGGKLTKVGANFAHDSCFHKYAATDHIDFAQKLNRQQGRTDHNSGCPPDCKHSEIGGL